MQTSFKSNLKISCKTETKWSNGTQLFKHLKMNNFYGRSGQIEFNRSNGLRNNIKFFIIDKLKTSIDLVYIKTSKREIVI